ncbi:MULTISPECIES: response regulator transcription factor [unclassified Desulfovibrio]|uniref:response regulator transcription factor n=1 Tax=unclassified Desulfovibrio TaxID=2593640 RepID=UPI000F5EAD3A|nr:MULTISPECIES: LuxR C-terminal-related transcriptional regulator [unclassified Desulfovibrio]RRD70408.1 LuxR family transcriptional regulator [Desulfovibrio sp. OH1209_COT-279]RRD86886.1 LuxR family transcriptional regulator [Desulfovibrio sp. OH1186_COT-070]
MASGAKKLPLLSGAGMACLLAAQFVVFLEGRGGESLSFELQGALAGFCGGILLGGLLFSTKSLKRLFPLCIALFTFISAALWAGSAVEGNAFFTCGACFWGGMLLPPLLEAFFARSSSPGFHVGIVFACGDFFWLLLYVFPLSVEAMHWTLLVLQCAGGGAATACLFREKQAPQERERSNGQEGLSRQALTSLRYLTTIALLFFLLDSFVDITFYRIHSQVFPIPAQVHLYIWIVYPIAGLLIDRYGADMRILLACIGGVILSPVLIVVSEGTVVYWSIYAIDLSCRGIATVYFLLVFAQIGKNSPRKGLIAAVPYVTMLAAFLGVSRTVESFPGTVPVASGCLFLTAAFSYVSARIQYALTLSGMVNMPAPGHADEREEPLAVAQAVRGNVWRRTDRVADFALKYGISPRERDVLWLLLEGCDTAAVCARLHISENTLKTHIRQLLRKTETCNRSALLVLFFAEESREKEDMRE